MDVVHKRELLGDMNGDEKSLHFTHVNIRQSIAILYAKLVIFELLAAIGIILFHTLVIGIRKYSNSGIPIVTFNPYIFLLLVSIKVGITTYIIHEWYEEYYEISGSEVSHYRGHIFKRHEHMKLEHIASIKLEQGILGRIFNFGTIRLHSWFLGKDYFLYQIHNPKKYELVLADLAPRADKMRKVVYETDISKEDVP